MMLSVGSLFSGIGGFELGLERTGGFETVWQCEKDEFCLKVLAKHWPDVTRFTDIKEMKEDIPYVDVICGGFPCQDISCAGKGAGIHAERSGLWWEMLRIVCLVRPRYVLVENVAALLNRGLDEVLGSLAESGYDAEWRSICANEMGACHRRERLFCIAYPNGEHGTEGMGHIPVWKKTIFREDAGDCTKFRVLSPSGVNRGDNGLSRRLDKDRIRALGNAIVPQCSEYVGRCLLASISEGPA